MSTLALQVYRTDTFRQWLEVQSSEVFRVSDTASNTGREEVVSRGERSTVWQIDVLTCDCEERSGKYGGRREQSSSTCTAWRGEAGGNSSPAWKGEADGSTSLAWRETSRCGPWMLAGGLPFPLCVVLSSISARLLSYSSRVAAARGKISRAWCALLARLLEATNFSCELALVRFRATARFLAAESPWTTPFTSKALCPPRGPPTPLGQAGTPCLASSRA